MKKPLLFCLLFLLLGNTFDGLITHWGVQVYGIDLEASTRTQELIRNAGLEAHLVDKLVYIGFRDLLASAFAWVMFSISLGQFYGDALVALVAILRGARYIFAGSTWLFWGGASFISGLMFFICQLVVHVLLAPFSATALTLLGCALLYRWRRKRIGGLLGMSSNRSD